MVGQRLVRKGNKVLKVDDATIDAFLNEGYDEINESGKVIKASPDKTYSAAEVERLRATDRARIAELEKQLEKLRKKSVE